MITVNAAEVTNRLDVETLERESLMIVTVTLRDDIVPPHGPSWLSARSMYTAVVVLVDDQEALVRIIGPKGAHCILSTRDVRRVGDDWPEH